MAAQLAVKKKGLFGSKDVVKIKAKIDIVVLAVQSLGSKLEGHEVWVTWKRGSRSSNSGETRKHVVRRGEVVLEEPISFSTTLTQDAKTDKFESKKIELKVKEERKDHSVGKSITVDLATIAKKGTHETRTFPLEKGKKDSPILIVSFTTDWVKINGKRLTKVPGGSQIGGAPKGPASVETVRIDGEDYVLSPDDTPSAADTTAGELSDEDADEAPMSAPTLQPQPATTPVAPTWTTPTTASSPTEASKLVTTSSSAIEEQLVALASKLAKTKAKYKKEKEKRKADAERLKSVVRIALSILDKKYRPIPEIDERSAGSNIDRKSMQSRELELLRTQLSNLTNGDAANQAVQLQMEIERLKEEQSASLRQAKRSSKMTGEDQTLLLREIDSLKAQLAEAKSKTGSKTTAKGDELAVLSRDFAAAQAEIVDLKKEKDSIREKIVDQKKLVENAIAERDNAKKEASDARTKHRMMQGQLDEQKERLSAAGNSVTEERQMRLEMDKLKAENKVLKFDREQYRDKLSEVERRAKALPVGVGSTKDVSAAAAATANHDQSFWMYAFGLLFVLNLILIRYF